MNAPRLHDNEFRLFQQMIYDTAGIKLTDAKKALVSGRLAKRIKHFGLASFAEYFRLISAGDGDEKQNAVDLLTTNETFFFREAKHFDFLRDTVLPDWRGGPRRAWSAACSSGEEAYTLAMVLAEHSPTDAWEIVGTDISTRVLERARRAQYPMGRAGNIPKPWLSKYCLRGIGRQEGNFMVCPELRERVRFLHANLKADLGRIGMFDLVFLRNVLIYFDLKTKRDVLDRVVERLNPGAYLIVGHAESLNGVTRELALVMPSIYRRPW